MFGFSKTHKKYYYSLFLRIFSYIYLKKLEKAASAAFSFSLLYSGGKKPIPKRYSARWVQLIFFDTFGGHKIFLIQIYNYLLGSPIAS